MWHNTNIYNFVNHSNKLKTKKQNNKVVLFHQHRIESKRSKVVSHIRHLNEMVWKQITLYKIKKKTSRAFLKFHYCLVIEMLCTLML